MKSQEQVKGGKQPNCRKQHLPQGLLCLVRENLHSSCQEKLARETQNLTLDKGGNKLWKLTKTMNNENIRSAPICIQQDDNCLEFTMTKSVM